MPRKAADHYEIEGPYGSVQYPRGIVTSFDGEFAFLSNFYDRPFELGGRIVATAEHAYQAQKAAGQPHVQAMILSATTPGHAKRLGQRVKLREGWETIKVEVMRQILKAKFPAAPPPDDLSNLLCTAAAGKHLVEGNTWGDTFWGCVREPHDKGLWVGANTLGILLMERRKQLQHDIPF